MASSKRLEVLIVPLVTAHAPGLLSLIPLVTAIPPIRGRSGRPLQLPRELSGDRGYDHDKYRRLLCAPLHHPAHRPPRHRPRIWPWPPPVGDRARFRLAARLQTAPHPV
jgi:hypothetical protein